MIKLFIVVLAIYLSIHFSLWWLLLIFLLL